jgi:hypothetical protein
VIFSHIPKFEILGCDKTTSLNRNLVPKFSETKKKRMQITVKTEWNWLRCTGHHGWDVLSFLYRHLIHPSLSVVLVGLGQGWTSIAGWWWCWSSFRCQRRTWTWVGAWFSEMALLSTIIAFLARWVLGRSMVSRGPWSTLIPSVWSLKEVGAWNHLPLWGNKSLLSRLRHRLRTLSDGAEDRSSRWRIDIDAGPGVGALLTLMFVLALAWQYSSPILEHKSLVYHGLKILKVSGFQSIGKSIIQSIEETLLLLLIGIHVIWSVARKLHETGDILAHRHGFLLQILELLFLELDNALRYVMRAESYLELIPVDGVRFFVSFYNTRWRCSSCSPSSLE